MKYPTLEDYDTGSHMVRWAEYVGAHAHAPYDEEYKSEWAPERSTHETIAEAKASSAHAAERWRKYQDLLSKEREERRRAEIRARVKAQKTQDDLYRVHQERVRVAEEARLAQRAAELEAHKRRRQWELEQAEWAKAERAARERRYAEKEAKALRAEALGSGLLIRANKNVQIGSAIRMKAGEVWSVGKYWAERLTSDGHATWVGI